MLRKSFRLFSMLKPSNPYHVLNLQQDATSEQIRNRYYELAQKYHPDRDPSFAEKFKTINEAYQMLKDPQKRQQLDDDINTKGAPTVSKTDYSSTRYSYGNGYRKQQSQLQQQYLRRKAHYSGGMHHSATNDKFDFGLKLEREGEGGRKNARLKQQQETIRTVLSMGIVVVALFGVVELVFKVYDFNTHSHKKDSQVLKQSRR